MAVIPYQVITDIRGHTKIAWEGMANGDTGQPYPCMRQANRCVQAGGTWGSGGTVTMEGGNELLVSGSEQFDKLEDTQGGDLTLNASNRLEEIKESCERIRPNVTAGDGTTSVTVYLTIQGVYLG
jgi:hypothetical protein